jgi:trigger factor
MEELRANIEERLTRMARLEQASQARDAVLENLVSQIDFEVPEHLLNADIDARRKQITEQLAQAGLTVEQYLADISEDQTEDEFWADLEQRGEQALKAQIILDKVADERDIGVDQNDLTQHILRKAQNEGVPPQQIADHLQEHPHHIDEYMLEIRRGKALALIVESATVTDSDGAAVPLANLHEDGSVTEPEGEAEAEAVEDEVASSAEEPETEPSTEPGA